MASLALRQVSERGCRSTLKLTANYSAAFAVGYGPSNEGLQCDGHLPASDRAYLTPVPPRTHSPLSPHAVIHHRLHVLG